MKLALFALPAALLLTIVALVAGCGGGGGSGPLTLEEYFAQFDAVQAELYSQSAEAFEGSQQSLGSPFFGLDELPAVKDAYAAIPGVVDGFAGSLEDIDPPPEVAAAHDELIAASRAYAAAFEEAAAVLDEAETMEEFAALFEEAGPSIQTATAPYDDACRAVVDIAEATAIATSATCGGGG